MQIVISKYMGTNLLTFTECSNIEMLGIQIIRTHHDTILWLTLDKNLFFNLKQMFILVVYTYIVMNLLLTPFAMSSLLILFKVIFLTLTMLVMFI